MRFAGWFMLVIGVPFLIGGGVVGVLAIQQATEISAYHSAQACQVSAATHANCLQNVDGTVTAVTEFPGVGRTPADYSLDVRTSSTTLHLTFGSDSPMLGYVVDGDPAVVTMWRGVPVSVVTDGRFQATAAVPDTALARDITNSEEAAGLGMLLLVAAFASRENRRAADSRLRTRPAIAAAFIAIVLGGFVILFSGFALGGKPSRLGLDLAITGPALVVSLGLSVWAWWKAPARRLAAEAQGTRNVLGDEFHAPVVPASHPSIRPALTPAGAARRRALRTRLRRMRQTRKLGALVVGWVLPGLTVAVLFGLFFTSHDGPAARAYRHAPACVGETNLATCVGDFTAEINGVRTPANGGNGADVSYFTADRVINTWARLGGDSAAITRMASADENAHTLLRIRVWRGSVVGAELGGSWYWAWGDPPGKEIPTIFLTVSFALLLCMGQLRIHRRAVPGIAANRRRLLLDDVGQLVAAAGSIALLWLGFWPGAILAVAVLAWLGLSTWQSTQRRHVALAPLHAS